MYFVGLYADPDVTPSVAVFLEFSMKTLKKRYQVREIRQWVHQEKVEIDSEITAIHADHRYTVMRRIFSQDRRPARNVPTPPTLVMHFRKTDSARIDRLRERNIPIEGVAIRSAGRWKKEAYRTICLGENYFTCGPSLEAALETVIREKRLNVDTDFPQGVELEGLCDRINSISLFGEEADSPGGGYLNTEQRNTLIALSLPIWLRETVRKIRRY